MTTGDRDLGDKNSFPKIELDKLQKYGAATVIYLKKSSQTFGNIQSTINKHSPDIIYLNSMFSPRFTLIPLLAGINLKKKIILAPRGMLQKGAISNKPFKKTFFFLFFKLMHLDRKVIFHATNVNERVDIQNIFGNSAKVLVAQNFVKVPTNSQTRTMKESGELKLIYLSVISSKKNLLFFLKLLSFFKNEKIILDIYGAIKDEIYFSKLNEVINNSSLKISYIGTIENEKLEEIYKHYHFFILPSKGENFGHSIYEAMSFGKPVILSDQTPWRDLEKNKAGWDIALNDKQKWVDVINYSLKMDQTEYNKWSEGANEFAKKYYDENNPKKDYLKLFNL